MPFFRFFPAFLDFLLKASTLPAHRHTGLGCASGYSRRPAAVRASQPLAQWSILTRQLRRWGRCDREQDHPPAWRRGALLRAGCGRPAHPPARRPRRLPHVAVQPRRVGAELPCARPRSSRVGPQHPRERFRELVGGAGGARARLFGGAGPGRGVPRGQWRRSLDRARVRAEPPRQDARPGALRRADGVGRRAAQRVASVRVRGPRGIQTRRQGYDEAPIPGGLCGAAARRLFHGRRLRPLPRHRRRADGPRRTA